jgi:hypothetical protein
MHSKRPREIELKRKEKEKKGRDTRSKRERGHTSQDWYTIECWNVQQKREVA